MNHLSRRVALVLAALSLLVTAVVATAPPVGAVPGGGSAVFINELHYDNAGSDVGEFIEVAAPAGTDLTGWSLVFYNGNGGASYATVGLSGIVADAGEGYGFTIVNQSGIQNGSPDGVALIDTGSNVIQFLSYEGAFAATDGPASGQASTDIGVSEPSGSPVGASLQLTGTGTTAAEFTWTPPSLESPGLTNTGQSFGTPPSISPGDLVVNEVDYDQPTPPTSDSAEFVEIKNVTGAAIDLGLVDLVFVNGSTDSVYDTIALSGSLAAGDYYVVCGNAATVANCDLDDGPDTNFIQNGGPDAVAIDFGGTIIDTVSYEGDTVAPYTEGSGVGLEDAAADGVAGIARCDDGVDTDQNNVDFADARPLTPGTTNDCPNLIAPDLVVNEIDYDQVGADNAEYIEIRNNNTVTESLSGVDVVLVNGSGGSIYGSFALSGTLAAGDYYVLCTDSSTVPNCDNDALSSIQNGAPDAVALQFGGSVIDTVSYEGDTVAPYTEGTGTSASDSNSTAGVGLSRCQDGQDTDDNNTDFIQRAITPGAANNCPPPPQNFGACGDNAETLIHDVQGNGPASPLAGSVRVIEAVVVGDFEDMLVELGGFYLQEEDADTDGDATTSEGIFVDSSGTGPGVAVGDVVRARGTIVESFGQTELTNPTDIVVCPGPGTASAATLTLPVASVGDFEWYEGMLIDIPQTLHVSGNFNLGRFGEVDLSVGGPLDNPTNVVAPGAPALAQADLNNRSRVQLDDGSNVSNPLPLPPYIGVDDTLRTGDTIPGLTGVFGFSFGAYEVHPTTPVNFARINDRPTGPPAVGGSLTVASYNVLNYFLTVDDSGPICGPSGTLGCRGADTPAELADQRAKIVDALSQLDADLVGLVELENRIDDSPIADLVAGVNAIVGAGTYDYVATGAIGTDAIRVGIVYKPASVTPTGAFAVLDSSIDPTFIDTKNRPVLIQTFTENATGEVFTIAVNHLKSKGSPCDDVGDPDAGDGQGNCNGTRTAAALALVNYLATDPTGSGDTDFVITGDLNAYAEEDPVTTIEGAGYTDAIEAFIGSGYASGAYSFNFNSESGSLDHALTSASLTPSVTGADHWHVNADEPRALDYNNFNQPMLYNPDEFRSSDHDPILIGLQLAPPGPTCNGLAATIVGTEGFDVIWGTHGPDVIVSLGGRDIVFGRGGDDVICTDGGRDHVLGGAGDDYIETGDARDHADGGWGDDTIVAGAANDFLRGGFGTDNLDGGPGLDRCRSGEIVVNCEY